MNWIDIKEKLPELVSGQSEIILGFLNGNYWIGKIEEEHKEGTIQYNFFDDTFWCMIHITHWAKLTPPI